MKGEPTMKVSCWVTWLQGADNKGPTYDLYLHVIICKQLSTKKKKC